MIEESKRGHIPSQQIQICCVLFHESINLKKMNKKKKSFKYILGQRPNAALLLESIIFYRFYSTYLVLTPRSPTVFMVSVLWPQVSTCPTITLLHPILNFLLRPLPLRSTEVDKWQSIPDVSSLPGSGDLAVWQPR